MEEGCGGVGGEWFAGGVVAWVWGASRVIGSFEGWNEDGCGWGVPDGMVSFQGDRSED